MTKNEQINEIAKIIYKQQFSIVRYRIHICKAIAEKIYNIGYRKGESNE